MKKNYILALLLLTCITNNSLLFGQSLTLSVSPDNCMAPTPNSGTYTESGTMNGKPMYVKGANLRIIWSGSQWEIQGDDPSIGSVDWISGWNNTKNTNTPPADCWNSTFGCFIPTLSGPSAYPIISNTISSIVSNNTASTITYIITFSGTINNLTASNFNVVANGVTGTSIASVTQTGSPNIYSVVVNYGSGNGTVRLDVANDTGASALIGCSPTFPIQGGTFNTASAPVTLTSGDIAFTSHNSDGTDSFSFLVLRNGGLPIGTQIFFTDNGWNNLTSALTETEGTVLWEVTSLIPQLTQVSFSITGSNYTTSTGSTTAIGSNTISLSSSGDQILAFQGNMASPTFISAIHMNAESTGNLGSLTTWDDFTNGLSSTRSAIPPGLTNGTNAIMVVDGSSAPYTEFDNAIYNCTGAAGITVNDIRLSINNRANWTKDNTVTYNTAPNCTFLGNNSFIFKNKIKVFPNPAKDFVTIELANIKMSGYSLYDSQGRLIISKETTEEQTKINTSKLESGLYFLNIKTEAGEFNQGIIKN